MMDYFHSVQNFNPTSGDLLISEPYLPDPNFERTVILLCDHNEDGSFGFVLNKPSPVVFEDVVQNVTDFKEKLYIGGPVQQDTLHFIHRSPDLLHSEKKISSDVYWGSDYDQLLSLIDLKQLDVQNIRFFLGYSGWSPGQLEEELEAKSWIVYKNTSAHQIFDIDDDKLWQEVLKELGGKFKMFANYPNDPKLN